MNEFPDRYCEICNKVIAKVYASSGRKVPYSKYMKRRFCSYECKYKWQSEFMKVENPLKKDRLYHIWHGMKERCNNPNMNTSKWYSEKGINVCPEWEHDFHAFKQWSLENGFDYEKTRKEQSLDRKDNSKGYSPDNCRWVPHSVNCRNTSRNVLIERNGITKTAIEWAEETGLSHKTIISRAAKTTDPNIIFDKETRAHRSNTGIKGIIFDKKNNRYVVYKNHQYLGVRKTIEEAIALKEEA